MMMVGVFFTGPPADAAGGEDEDDGDGHACGETRRSSGTLQWPQCLPPQTDVLLSDQVCYLRDSEGYDGQSGADALLPESPAGGIRRNRVVSDDFFAVQCERFTGGFIGTPADLVNVRMQNDMKLPPELRRNYKHALDGLYRVWCEEGTRKLFSGATMASSRGALVTVGQAEDRDGKDVQQVRVIKDGDGRVLTSEESVRRWKEYFEELMNEENEREKRVDEEVMGKFGVKERNLERQKVVDFAKRMDMAVVNTYFQKEHRVTYKSGGRRTQVDYILCRRGNLKEISDCKVVVGESVARQHRMVVCRMTLMVCKTKRSKIEIEKKTKWWKLKKEECCEEFRQKLRQALGGQVVLPDDWETTAEVIRETGRKVLGVSSGRRKENKETWWWNEEVQDSVQRKRLAKKKWDMDRTEENRQEYKELQRRVKREVSKAKQKAYDELYTRLDTREGEKDLYRLARQRDRDGKDVQEVRVIKNRDGRVLTSEESVQRRWKEYFEELMNEENEREKRVEEVNSVEQKVDKIRKDEVRKASKRMKSGKAVGPDDIPVEVWKCLGEAAVEFLATLFNRVLERHSRSSTFSNLHLHTMEIFMELLSAQGMVMLEQCLACYDQAKQLVLATGFLGDNILTHFLSSFIALLLPLHLLSSSIHLDRTFSFIILRMMGGCATFLCQPLDVLKTRLMNSKGEYRGVLHCLTETAKLGPLAFYKGLVPAGIRLVPHTILTFMFLEQLRNYFGIRVIS
ncbi:hypothetical protein QTP86_023917 [Hemibagrus guttatus]|nr:hypothetical protein QTP86_023917 [Hemibagrus guttatus]